MIRIVDLSKKYPGKGSDQTAICEINLTISARSMVSLVGMSGCGKTSLLKCIAGLVQPTAGHVYVAGERVTRPHRKVVYLFQDYRNSLFPWKTVAENIELPLRASGLDPSERKARIQETLQLIGMEDRSALLPWQLSGGMQQRVALARALACRREVLLLDEPFSSLDEVNRATLADELRIIWLSYRPTIIVVTHDVDEAVYLAERVLVMDGRPGRITADIRVDLPRERDHLETRSSTDYLALRNSIYASLATSVRKRVA